MERLKGEPEEVHPETKKEVSEVLLEMDRNLSFDVKELTERRYREYCKCIKNLKKIFRGWKQMKIKTTVAITHSTKVLKMRS